ncbi:MAG: hypothetical protein WCB19_09510 [Thermoplasmata archaeon]
MPPTELNKTEYALVQELHFECEWFINAWDELTDRLSKGDRAMTSDSHAHQIVMWSYADRMLTHAARIDRILNPSSWGSQDRPPSRRARFQFARVASTHLPSNLFDQRDLDSLRGSVEHANERLPDFIAGRDINNLYPIQVGPLAIEQTPEASNTLRGFDPISKVCTVLGDRVDLERVHQSIRKLKFALPRQHLRTRVRGSDGNVVHGAWEEKHDREHSATGHS